MPKATNTAHDTCPVLGDEKGRPFSLLGKGVGNLQYDATEAKGLPVWWSRLLRRA